jgi:hypothetical protein
MPLASAALALRLLLSVVVLLAVAASVAHCWTSVRSRTIGNRARPSRHHLHMRDGSTAAVFFELGDSVKVVSEVLHRPNHRPAFTSKGLVGKVVSLWEKCEVDPHCCCAEQAFDAPIEVEFENDLYYEEKRRWTGHFAADELEKVRDK